jgi:hypothetical protein
VTTKKPEPLVFPEIKPRPVCSVCGKVSYSRGGVHPQCSEERADAIRVDGLKQASKAEAAAKAVAPQPTSRWHKVCPKCRKKIHVRKQNCDCGHQFVEGEKG